jgi:hypothetical protein
MLSRDVVMWGTIYGAAVFIVMNFVYVLPHSRLEITLVFAALAERGSRARVVRWLTDRLGSPTHYKPVQLQ